MEQETKIEEVNNEEFDTPEVESSENYESIGSSKILKGIGILAGIGGAALGAYALYKKHKKKKPIDVEYEEVNDCEEETESEVVVEENVSEPEESEK